MQLDSTSGLRACLWRRGASAAFEARGAETLEGSRGPRSPRGQLHPPLAPPFLSVLLPYISHFCVDYAAIDTVLVVSMSDANTPIMVLFHALVPAAPLKRLPGGSKRTCTCPQQPADLRRLATWSRIASSTAETSQNLTKTAVHSLRSCDFRPVGH